MRANKIPRGAKSFSSKSVDSNGSKKTTKLVLLLSSNYDLGVKSERKNPREPARKKMVDDMIQESFISLIVGTKPTNYMVLLIVKNPPSYFKIT